MDTTRYDEETNVALERAERLARAAQARAAARTLELGQLLAERPELAGTYAPADFAVDAVRWCA